MDKLVYDPYKKPWILGLMVECMEQVVEESPPVYREYASMMLDMLKKPNKSGLWPETYFIMSNRVGGKTYTIGKMILKMAMRHDIKFGLYCRKMKKMGKYARGVFKQVLIDCYPLWEMKEVKVSDIYTEVWMIRRSDDEDIDESEKRLVGFVLPLNSDSDLKDSSSELAQIEIMFMDEFQSNDSVSDETDKYINIHDTVARGKSRDGNNYGVRYLPTILCSNSLSITNKYLALFKLMDKIQSNTKLYRGEGVSLLRFKNENVAGNQMLTAFHKSLAGQKILESNIDNAWLNDNNACVAKPDGWGQSYYMCTIIDGEEKYGVSWYPDLDIYYISRVIDKTDRKIYNISPGGVENVPLLRKTNIFVELRRAYADGTCRFSDQALKNLMEKIYL